MINANHANVATTRILTERNIPLIQVDFLGNQKSLTLSLEVARELYEDLHEIFTGIKAVATKKMSTMDS